MPRHVGPQDKDGATFDPVMEQPVHGKRWVTRQTERQQGETKRRGEVRDELYGARGGGEGHLSSARDPAKAMSFCRVPSKGIGLSQGLVFSSR